MFPGFNPGRPQALKIGIIYSQLLPRLRLEELPPEEPRERVPEDLELLRERVTLFRDELLEDRLVLPIFERLRLEELKLRFVPEL